MGERMLTVQGAVPVENGAKSYYCAPPKGKLVFFQHGLGADWKEFAMTIAGTSHGHNKDGTVKKNWDNKKYGFRKVPINGLVQRSERFWDAGVIWDEEATTARNRDKYYSVKLWEQCSHKCQDLQINKIFEKLKQGTIVCIITEFSSGTEYLKTQHDEMANIVKRIEAEIKKQSSGYREFDYDVAFVGHSMGGLTSINYGITYAKNNPNRKVSIITVCTPYYENELAKFEYDYPGVAEPIMMRSNKGALNDLAGYSNELMKLQDKWNVYHKTNKNITLGAISVQAQGPSAEKFQKELDLLEKDLARLEEQGHYLAEEVRKRRDAMIAKGGYGSDYIVPADVQLGIISPELSREFDEMKNKISAGMSAVGKVYDDILGPLRSEFRVLEAQLTPLKGEKERLVEATKSLKGPHNDLTPAYDLADVISKIQTLESKIAKIQRDIAKQEGFKAKLPYYNKTKEWENVKTLALISNPHVFTDTIRSLYIFSYKTAATTSMIEQVFEDVKAAEVKYDYHHLNTPDLQEVIDCIRDTLIGGI